MKFLKRAVALAAACTTLVSGPSYADKPATIIVPYGAGGTVDISARIVAQGLSEAGKTAIVENRAGGGGVIGWGAAAKAAPDGQTLLMIDTSFAMAEALLPGLPFDPKKDFAQITTVAKVPYVMVVTPSLPVKSVKELIALSKAKPGSIYYGSGGTGSSTHLGAELFQSLSGADITHVPYKGAAAAMQDLMGGQVQVLFTAIPTALPHIKSGKLRALMVSSAKRVALLPDVPSAPEAGVPKMIADNWVGLAVPGATSKEIMAKWHKDIAVALKAPASHKRFEELGLTVVANSPAEAAGFVGSEIKRWGDLVGSNKIKPE
ncbi:tripartite tricarboxylate transporter substrate binding protein [Pseudogulbenkiania sp. MAI-1]|uniref:tripartite tricarboxylate transporter substrate binding protein n=1 Tax=Pseudogulbenkiania sp. MAI-1 TaxID=990370 RepID=UPI00045E69E6|nr:tripartite tricarboxylate transporter substrate binding protein [Pseudogulbenkiania sp. MAI-1]